MPTNFLLNISVKYWQDFQDTLAKIMDTNIYIFDVNGGSFSRFSLPIEPCKEANQGTVLCNERCIGFYKSIFGKLKDKAMFTCPYGLKLWAYRLGNYTQKVGFLVITHPGLTTQAGREEEITFAAKAHNIYRTINEVFNAILEKKLIGLRSLELNSIYEISRLMTSIVELDKVLDLITNSLIIIYQADMCFVGLREGDRIRIAQSKGEYGGMLSGKEWPLVHPLIEEVFSRVEPSLITLDELRSLPELDNIAISSDTEILFFPLRTALGTVGLLGIVAPVPGDNSGLKNLQIYANFAAVALANATLIRRLEKEAETDFLTGLLNKRSLRKVLATELEKAMRYGYPLSIIFLDIDDFKAYNDSFGHLAGDIVLQKTAEIIRSSIRSEDIACRYGGEEFVVILPGTKREDAAKVAERIRRSIEAYPFPYRQVTASLGAASMKKSESVDSLLERADQACYEAKRRGKNRLYLTPL